ncbi:MAG TPA: ribosome biogenesis GTP-binding protein YihA/YsxC [Syntrophorhabdus sp.]|nr:ribosome biogenesis GTP-binding protein YihA/YsxC [Syntrophorhabdus sp.]HQI96179.1 ribosome biogenesis GTP-binding protein YihA/YsxC [Syntrophorhabdus sp.]
MKILTAEYLTTVVKPEKREFRGIPEICFIGRSNVGKSSLINRLAMRKIARTSSTPGATKAINLYRVGYEFRGLRKWTIFSDFPGFGYSKVARSTYLGWESMIDTYITENSSIQGFAWAFDIRRDPDILDKTVLEWIEYSRLPFCLILTKCDKERRSYGLSKRNTLKKEFCTDDVFVFSSKNGYGRDEVLTHLFSTLSKATESV